MNGLAMVEAASTRQRRPLRDWMLRTAPPGKIRAWGVAVLSLSFVISIAQSARASVPEMPSVLPVPTSGQEPLSSAKREGTEYSDLAAAHYAEEEFYLFGRAPAITAQGKSLFEAPYTTRILVRKPRDPRRFNGTVIIEPFTWYGDRGASWIVTRNYLLRKGYAYVGYTLNINAPKNDPKFPPLTEPLLPRQALPDLYRSITNLEFMRTFDYARYAPLGLYYDGTRFTRGGRPDPFPPQSQAIGAQLALLLKSNRADGPLAGLAVKRVYVNSWAVTAQVWVDYLDQDRHRQWTMPGGRPLIDAYMAARTRGGSVAGDPVRAPRGLSDTAPFVFLYTQTEALRDARMGIALPPDSNRPRLRYYEIAGTSHLRRADLGTWEREYEAQDVGKANDPNCLIFYDEPIEYVASALLDGMDRWVRTGVAMPRETRMVRVGNAIARDPVTGNMQGGVRPPWIAVPSATYLNDSETGCGLIYDTKAPFGASRLRQLYGSYETYRQQFEAAKARSIADGFLLPEDANRLAPLASPADFDPTLKSQDANQ